MTQSPLDTPPVGRGPAPAQPPEGGPRRGAPRASPAEGGPSAPAARERGSAAERHCGGEGSEANLPPRTDEASDALLVERARAGNAVAFETLVRRYQAAVHGAAFAALPDPDVAADAAQETFLVAWRTLGRLRDAARLRSWLCGIARNLAVSEARRRGRAGMPIEAAPEPALPDPVAAQAEAEALGADSAALRLALAELPERQRAIVCLRYFDGLAYRQIAEALGVTVDVVQVTLFRAKRALAKKLGKKPGEGPTTP